MIDIPHSLAKHEVGYYIAYTVLQVKTPQEIMVMFGCSRRTARRRINKFRNINLQEFERISAVGDR